MKLLNAQLMVMASEGIIFNIKRFSVHDGPGIRTTIFLKGCPLNCIWCHNPEGISQGITIWYNRNICIACGKCTESCPNSALTLKSADKPFIEIDRSLCNVAGDCVRVCPTGAIDFTGMRVTTGQVMDEIRKDAVFYRNSGGGVTLSGGEPLFQPDFCISILKACREEGFNTAIETCLFCEKESLEESAEYADLFLVDMKIFDNASHEAYTGKRNDIIKENLKFIAVLNKDIVVRVPLIKGITDSAENRRSIEKYVKEINRGIIVEYLDYNPLTKSKYQKLAMPYLADPNL